MHVEPNALDQLAALTGHPCPQAWTALLSQFPAGLAARRYPGLDDRVADHELLDDLAAVVALNEDIREDDVWGDGDEEDMSWLSTRLAIGKDMSGDIVFIDVTHPDPPVQRYLVSSGRIIEMAPNLPTLVAMLDTETVFVPRV